MPDVSVSVYASPPSSSSSSSSLPCRPFRVITPASVTAQQHNLSINNKRKRDLLDSGSGSGSPQMNQFRVVVRQPLVAPLPGSSFGPTGKLKAKPPKAYTTADEVLAALSKTCAEDPEVDFSGSYIVPDADSIPDKTRVQMVTNDIWKATGYRFTVKDHPPTDRGHKTRLWCSQDEARRSKHRGNADGPRQTKQGELFAKQRFPCRSRLMITCLPSTSSDAGGGARVVTIRMHHYVRHEAYLESAAEAAANASANGSGVGASASGSGTGAGTSGGGAGVGTNGNGNANPTAAAEVLVPQFLSAITAPLPPALLNMNMGGGARGARGDIELPRAPPVAPPPPPLLHEHEGEWDTGNGNATTDARRRRVRAADRPKAAGAGAATYTYAAAGAGDAATTTTFPAAGAGDAATATFPAARAGDAATATFPAAGAGDATTTTTTFTFAFRAATGTITFAPPAASTSASTPPPSSHPSLPVPSHPPPAPAQQQQHQHQQQQQHPHPHPPPAQHPHPAPQPQPPHISHNTPAPAHAAPLTPAEFTHRMRAHISRIRDFCDGLEYQVQFNDYRMLEALERDAAPFLGMVERCLREEGR
ncbi:hypothetical protein K438DRAFT_1755723 [Mycena galopus ATCC 62051]|nr:hypothetical protein K438DRAFT_1755723 [Mycena galopus ATCC 62051]